MAFLASCPENAFQRVPQGYSPFTAMQRAGAVVRNGTKLLAVGFGASLFGVSITNLLIAVRQQLDPSWQPLNAPQVSPFSGIHQVVGTYFKELCRRFLIGHEPTSIV